VTVKCRKCGRELTLEEKQAVCSSCRSILRRCADCAHYEVRTSSCRRTNQGVDVGEANYPTFSSPGTYCRDYTPTVAVA
jgi:hypothetical protein